MTDTTTPNAIVQQEVYDALLTLNDSLVKRRLVLKRGIVRRFADTQAREALQKLYEHKISLQWDKDLDSMERDSLYLHIEQIMSPACVFHLLLTNIHADTVNPNRVKYIVDDLTGTCLEEVSSLFAVSGVNDALIARIPMSDEQIEFFYELFNASVQS